MSENEQENEKRESVADIVAEMLERADAMQTHGTTHGVRLAIREFARRIKSAWKRERSKVEADALAVGGIVEATRTAEKSSAVGNAAAMREALRYIIRQIDKNPERLSSGQLLCIIGDKAESALSAPARNCDFYDNKTDAETRFVEETGENDMAQHYWQMFANWLFYNNERKGDGDGR